MTDKIDTEIDQMLARAARASHEVDPALLQAVTEGTIKPSLHPVRPLPPARLLTAGVVLACAAVAFVGAVRLGFYGFAKMDWVDRALVFPVLAVVALVAGAEFVHEMIPGSRRWISPGMLLGFGSMVLVAVFALLFRDYQTDHFFSAGLICLGLGCADAVPAALLGWLVLRRGFAVNPVTAGFIAGICGGVAGIAMLELHCPNFQAAHILVWHTAVLPCAAAAGALAPWLMRRLIRVNN